MTYEIHEPDRGRVLPGPAGQHTTVTTWAAQLTCDADLRTTSSVYRDLAARLVVVEADGGQS